MPKSQSSSQKRTFFRFKFRKEYSLEYIENMVEDYNQILLKDNDEANTIEIDHERYNSLTGDFLTLLFEGDKIVRFIQTGASGSGRTMYRCVMVDAKYSTNKKFMI